MGAKRSPRLGALRDIALSKWPARLITATTVAYHMVGTFKKLAKDYDWSMGAVMVPFEQEF
jgi:hypothetical protein